MSIVEMSMGSLWYVVVLLEGIFICYSVLFMRIVGVYQFQHMEEDYMPFDSHLCSLPIFKTEIPFIE